MGGGHNSIPRFKTIPDSVHRAEEIISASTHHVGSVKVRWCGKLWHGSRVKCVQVYTVFIFEKKFRV